MKSPAEGRRVGFENSKTLVVSTTLLYSAVALGVFFVVFQATRNPAVALQKRLPGMDSIRRDGQVEESSPVTKGRVILGAGVPSNIPDAWPRFRGANSDGVATGPVVLARSWKAGTPSVLWDVMLGEGYAGAAVLNGRVYILDYDQDTRADALRCLSLTDGREIWRFAYPIKIKRNHGMSRTVPAVTDQYVVALGPKCHVVCLNSTSGSFLWGIDLVREYNTEIPQWYAGQCPLIDDNRAIIAPGGDALMIAVDCASGKVIWKTPNPRDWKMTHSSIVPMEFAGRRMYLYCASGGVVGVSAETGEILWDSDAWQIAIANVPSPVPVGDGKIFLSGGYNAGSLMLQLTETNGRFSAAPVFRLKASEFGATQATPILYQGHVYGVRPDGQLACLDLKGTVKWTSGSASRFGLGPFLVANGLIFVMNDEGLLTLAEASPSGYRPLSQAHVLSGHDSWAPMALVGGRLLARDLTRMVCLDVTGEKL